MSVAHAPAMDWRSDFCLLMTIETRAGSVADSAVFECACFVADVDGGARSRSSRPHPRARAVLSLGSWSPRGQEGRAQLMRYRRNALRSAYGVTLPLGRACRTGAAQVAQSQPGLGSSWRSRTRSASVAESNAALSPGA